MKIYGAFLLIGPTMQPCVELLDEKQIARLNAQLRLASKHGKDSLRHGAYSQVFHVPAHWAIPCWMPDACTAIAQSYVGANQEQVRGLAARIALGMPYGPDDTGGSSDSEGGQRAPIDPVKPKPRKPSGGNKVKPAGAEALMFGSAA